MEIADSLDSHDLLTQRVVGDVSDVRFCAPCQKTSTTSELVHAASRSIGPEVRKRRVRCSLITYLESSSFFLSTPGPSELPISFLK